MFKSFSNEMELFERGYLTEVNEMEKGVGKTDGPNETESRTNRRTNCALVDDSSGSGSGTANRYCFPMIHSEPRCCEFAASCVSNFQSSTSQFLSFYSATFYRSISVLSILYFTTTSSLVRMSEALLIDKIA